MANAGIPKGNQMNTLKTDKGINNKSGAVNVLDHGANAIGIPYGQAPGLGNGVRENSMNELPSTARVVKPATSNLMTGMSQNRGAGGNK